MPGTPNRALRASLALLTAAAFVMPLGTPVLCARMHTAAAERAASQPCHGSGAATVAVPDGVPAFAGQAPASDRCGDMPWCGVVPMAPIRDVHHPLPLTPDHREEAPLPLASAPQRGIQPDIPPPRA